GALVALDGVHHPLEDGVEELARLLGVPVGQQLHGAPEVGEEDRDLLALALEGGLRGEDLFGEGPRSVRLRGRRPNRGRAAPGDGLAALEAEAGAPGKFCATGAAGEREAGAAAEAESGGSRGVLLAPRTGHGRTGSPPS